MIDGSNTLVAETKVTGSSAATVRVGDPVQVVLPQHRGVVDGKVSSVGIISTDQSGVESVPVTVMITGKPPGISPGVTADVEYYIDAEIAGTDRSVRCGTHERDSHLRR